VKKVIRTIVAMALALTGIVSVAPAAQAHSTRVDAVVVMNGEWKAYAWVDTGSGKLCVRAYNSPAGAQAYAVVSSARSGEVWGRVWDDGGDTANHCTWIANPGARHGLHTRIAVNFSRAGSQWVDGWADTYFTW
jgi:hypothetical protein